MSSKTAPGSVHKRFETDKEFRARMNKDACYVPDHKLDVALDDYAWRFFRKQRRIIEVAL